jgi:septin family protein
MSWIVSHWKLLVAVGSAAAIATTGVWLYSKYRSKVEQATERGRIEGKVEVKESLAGEAERVQEVFTVEAEKAAQQVEKARQEHVRAREEAKDDDLSEILRELEEVK